MGKKRAKFKKTECPLFARPDDSFFLFHSPYLCRIKQLSKIENMKKTIIKCVVVTCGVIVGCYQYSQKENNISDVVLQNIEALAGGEYYEDTFCYGRGSVDCLGHKVEMKIEGLSLD